MNSFRFSLIFVLISISSLVFAYSPLLFDRSQMVLKDVVLEELCPSGIKGKGYCDPRFVERWEVNTGTTTDLDRNSFFNPHMREDSKYHLRLSTTYVKTMFIIGEEMRLLKKETK